MKPFRNVVGLYHGLRSALADPTVQGLLTLVTVASLFYAAVEGWSLLIAAYFAVVTIATIGYGDLVPKSAAGKVFTIVYVICGIGISAAGTFCEHIADKARRD